MTILRAGKVVADLDADGRVDQNQLIRWMVGELVPAPERARHPDRTAPPVVQLEGISGALPGGRRLESISLQVRAGEVMGIAGVEGNGQSELAAALTGSWLPPQGRVILKGRPIGGYSAADRTRMVADIPDDHELATSDQLTVWENLGLTVMMWSDAPTPAVRRRLRQQAAKAVQEFNIRTPSIEQRVGYLSGGNRRRVVVARELGKKPLLSVLSDPTKGLDVRSVEQFKKWVRDLADQGTAVVYIGSDLDELIQISDRVAVLHLGRVTGVLDAAHATVERIGRLMLTGA